jgi:hypothetical protein
LLAFPGNYRMVIWALPYILPTYTSNPRIELYRIGERFASERFESYIDAAWGIGNRLGDLGLGTNDSLPYFVKVMVPEELRSDDHDRANRSEFMSRLDRIGMNHSVIFVEGGENSGETKGEVYSQQPEAQSTAKEPPEAPRESKQNDPLKSMLDDYQLQYDEVKVDSERRLEANDSRFRKGVISRKQYNSRRAEILKDEVEKEMQLREELFRRLREGNRGNLAEASAN